MTDALRPGPSYRGVLAGLPDTTALGFHWPLEGPGICYYCYYMWWKAAMSECRAHSLGDEQSDMCEYM